MHSKRALRRVHHDYSHSEPIIEEERDGDGRITGKFHLGWRDVRGDGRELGTRLFTRRRAL